MNMRRPEDNWRGWENAAWSLGIKQSDGISLLNFVRTTLKSDAIERIRAIMKCYHISDRKFLPKDIAWIPRMYAVAMGKVPFEKIEYGDDMLTYRVDNKDVHIPDEAMFAIAVIMEMHNIKEEDI